MRSILTHFFIVSALCVGITWGQTTEEEQAELARKTQNPVSDLISLPLQNNTTFKMGGTNSSQNVLNIQPVYPVKLNENWNMITRTILPVISQPNVLTGGNGRKNGLGDINATAFFSPAGSGKWIWGVGPVASVPTATSSSLGTRRFAIGPAAVLLTMRGPWVFGGLINNLWDVGGKQGRTHMNQMLFQPFVNYNLSNGWYVVSAPIITANWEISGHKKWTVPVGAGVGKIFRVGKMPLNASLHYYYNVKKTTTGGDWGLRAQVQFLFPKGQ